MKLIPRAHWLNNERFMQRQSIERFKEVAFQILQRDQFTCQYCGIQSQKYLEVVNQDGNYTNNSKKNMVAACSFCARSLLLDYYSLSYKGEDRIIYLPELTQEKLNHLTRTLFVAMLQEGEDRAFKAKLIYSSLRDRVHQADELSGVALSHPGTFAYVLATEQLPLKATDTLRWLPSFENFQEEVSFWNEEDAILREGM